MKYLQLLIGSHSHFLFNFFFNLQKQRNGTLFFICIIFYFLFLCVCAGCVQTVAIIGPIFGFLLGSFCAELYVDIGFVNLGKGPYFYLFIYFSYCDFLMEWYRKYQIAFL